MTQHERKSVLVYRTGQLGDTLVSLPALYAISARHPGTRLALLTDVHPGKGFLSSWDILAETGLFSEAVFYEPRPNLRRKWRDFWRLASRLRRSRFKRLYYLAPACRTRRQILRDRLFFQVLCGIPDIRGMTAQSQAGVSERARLLRIAEGSENTDAPLPIGRKERARIDALWRKTGLDAGACLIALGPGAKISAKRWPADRYAALARKLLEALPDSRVLLIGGPDDYALAQTVVEGLGPRALNWAGRLSVLESAEVLRRCSLYVGNDSGVMHLAASVKTRCVAIFSARDAAGLWEPYGEGHRVLRKHVPCAGCLLSECQDMALLCLTGITIDEVLESCLSVLSSSRAPVRST